MANPEFHGTPATSSRIPARKPARLALLLLSAVAPLTGCYSVKIRPVQKTIVIDNVRDVPLQDLLKTVQTNYDAVQTIYAKVQITASTGGAHAGEIKEIPTFGGYMFLRKPSDLRVLLQLPFVGSTALDMVTDGKEFKLSIPPKNKAVTGPETITTPSAKGFENLRPNIIRDALQVPPVSPDEYVALTESSRILASETKKHEMIEEPDYDLTVLGPKSGHVLERRRVIHMDRINLEPYEQDVFDSAGRLVTVINYSRYTKFGDIDFPTLINIRRPIDEYSLKIDISKLTLNQKLDDEQFVLKFPEGVPVQTMK